MKDRIGKIEISRKFIFEKGYKSMKVLMKEFVPLHIDYIGYKDSFIYTGYSDHFDIMDVGSEPPKYLFKFEENDKGFIEFKSIAKIEG